MHGVLLGVAALACPLGMGLMMWFMAKGMRTDTSAPREVSPLDDVDALRAEHRRLGAQIDELERAEAPASRRVDRVRS